MGLYFYATCDCCNKRKIYEMEKHSRTTFLNNLRKRDEWQSGQRGVFCTNCKTHYRTLDCKMSQASIKLSTLQDDLNIFEQALIETDFDEMTFHYDEYDTLTWYNKEEVLQKIEELKDDIVNANNKIEKIKREIRNER